VSRRTAILPDIAVKRSGRSLSTRISRTEQSSHASYGPEPDPDGVLIVGQVPSRLTADKPPVGDAVTPNSGLSSVAVWLSGTDRGPVMLYISGLGSVACRGPRTPLEEAFVPGCNLLRLAARCQSGRAMAAGSRQ
jgi:hypothetical protein